MEIIEKFHSVLPEIRNWIEGIIETHKSQAISASELGFPNIQQTFPADFLDKAKVVYLESKIPFPPLSKMGLHELSGMESMNMAGVTFKDTFFVHHLQRTESLHFHELVHVAQWDRLGVDNFLLAYGVGLMQFGYRDSPFEGMAYSLQNEFERGNLPNNIINLIHQQTDLIWKQVEPLFQ